MTPAAWLWTAALAGVLLLVYATRDALAPFVAGAAVAYLLNPLVERGARFAPRPLIAVLGCAGFFALGALALAAFVPWAAGQTAALLAVAPDALEAARAKLVAWGVVPTALDAQALGDALRSAFDSEHARAFAARAMAVVWRGGGAVAGFASFVVITPVVAAYLLVAWRPMTARLDALIPPRHAPAARELLRDMDNAVAGFVRGQLLVCATLAVFYAVGLSLLGVPFGGVIGAAAGAISFIPFIGALLGGAVGLAAALWGFGLDWPMLAATLGVFVVGQTLEGWVLTPYLVGARTGLHPVWLLLALAAFGSLFGFTGLLLAAPLAAALGAVVRFAVRAYLRSRFYSMEGAPSRRTTSRAPPSSSASDARPSSNASASSPKTSRRQP